MRDRRPIPDKLAYLQSITKTLLYYGYLRMQGAQ
jgi:hypothetical protein